MKISHEVPVSLLEESKQFNDYDYALVHLFESLPEKDYYQFYRDSVKAGRHVLLDNSLFELGEAFDSKKFAFWISRLEPTEYVIPDVWCDAKGTMDSASEWLNGPGLAVPKSCQTIGVVQGKTYEEIVDCYKFFASRADKVAFSFGNPYYQEICPHPNKHMALALGRIQLMSQLLNDKVIFVNKPHHLLGCALPIEFFFYRDFKFSWIDTIDTSSPIVHGMIGTKYEPAGLLNKQEFKMAEMMDSVIDEGLFPILEHNINLFRSYVKGVNRPSK